jgi:hypothetical protein
MARTNEEIELHRQAIKANEIPYDGHCLKCGFTPVGADLLCRECGNRV